jgi:excisionase family DNA binding protein
MKDQENFLADALKSIFKDALREELAKFQTPEPEKLLLNVTEAAKLLNVPGTWLASMAREQKIKSIKLGHYVRFSRADLESFILQIKDQGEKETAN